MASFLFKNYLKNVLYSHLGRMHGLRVFVLMASKVIFLFSIYMLCRVLYGRGPIYVYNGVLYPVMSLFEDVYISLVQFCELHLIANVVVGGLNIKVRGVFHHRKYIRVSHIEDPFQNLTMLNSLKKRITREDKSIVMRDFGLHRMGFE